MENHPPFVYVARNGETAWTLTGQHTWLTGVHCNAEQVATSRAWYNPHWHYENDPETRAASDLIVSDHFSHNEPGIFAPLRDALLTHGDFYMHLADLASYGQRHDTDAWSMKAILNVAGSGKFSSDCPIAEYATVIWGVKPCPVP